MRRITFLLLIAMLAGCKNTNGPFAASRQKEKNPDPLLTSEEKRASNRERIADPDDRWYLPAQNLNGSSPEH